MKKNKHLVILRTLLFSIGLIVSSNVHAAKQDKYEIGILGPGGGLIFHISDDGKHGLEVAQEDLGDNSIPWGDGSYKFTHATKRGLYDGSFNTNQILINLFNIDYAAMFCANYNGGGYGDWYLPSMGELELIYINLHVESIGNFADGIYWGSSELNGSFAWGHDFSTGSRVNLFKSNHYRIRAVRAF